MFSKIMFTLALTAVATTASERVAPIAEAVRESSDKFTSSSPSADSTRARVVIPLFHDLEVESINKDQQQEDESTQDLEVEGYNEHEAVDTELQALVKAMASAVKRSSEIKQDMYALARENLELELEMNELSAKIICKLGAKIMNECKLQLIES